MSNNLKKIIPSKVTEKNQKYWCLHRLIDQEKGPKDHLIQCLHYTNKERRSMEMRHLVQTFEGRTQHQPLTAILSVLPKFTIHNK